MIKRLKILQVEFSPEIARSEIPAFRAAVAGKAGHEHVLFHNHTADGLRHSYPLIQYKTIYGKPAVVCIEEGVDEIHHFFKQANWNVNLNGHQIELKIEKLNVNQYTLQVWDSLFTYSIINWLALNRKNYTEYQELTDLGAQLEFLERMLTANIISFAKGVNWTITKKIHLRIIEQTARKIMTHKGVRLSAFDLRFTTNVFLPNYIGIGKGASHGFGTVKQIRKKK